MEVGGYIQEVLQHEWMRKNNVAYICSFMKFKKFVQPCLYICHTNIKNLELSTDYIGMIAPLEIKKFQEIGQSFDGRKSVYQLKWIFYEHNLVV